MGKERDFAIWRWRIFGATYLCYVGLYFCRRPYSTVKSSIGKDLDFDAATLGYIYAAYLIAYMAGQFLSGAIGGYFGPRKMLLAGMGTSILVAVAMGGSSSFAAFVALMVVLGIAQATGWSNCVANMGSWTPHGERGTIMGIWATNFQIGGILATPLAAWALQRWGWRSAFFTGAAALAAVWIVFWFNQADHPEDKGFDPLPEKPKDDGTAAHLGPWSARTWGLVLLIGGAYFGMKFIRYALWSWAPFVLERNFGLAGDAAGYASTTFDVCGFAGMIAIGRMSDRFFGGRHAIASFVVILGLILATAATFTIGTGSATAFTICIGAIGFALFGPDALMTSAAVMDLVGKNTVRASGIIGGLGAAGSVVQEVLIGKADGRLGPIVVMMLASAVMTAVCLAGFIALARKPAPAQAGPLTGTGAA